MPPSLGRCFATIRQGAYLPHWTACGATYAVCFRLGDSLPRPVIDAWRRDRAAILNQAGTTLTPEEENRIRVLFAERIERSLNSGQGACWLRQPKIAQLVADALRHFDGDRYELLAWCIMPNHVHVVVRPLGRHTLPEILKSWKGYSGTEASRLLGLHGRFWQPEYYDHLVRDADDLCHAIRYVEENPTKAGLRLWPWVWTHYGQRSQLTRLGGSLGDEPTGRETRAT